MEKEDEKTRLGEAELEEILKQIIRSLEQASDILDESYRKQDFQRFNQAKRLILQIQGGISEIIK